MLESLFDAVGRVFGPLLDVMASILALIYEAPVIGGSVGVAIIVLTVLLMALLTPLTIKSTKSMIALQEFQPEIQRIQREHRGDRQKMNEEMMAFYRENNINPLGSCLPVLAQSPVFIMLFNVIRGITRIGADGTFDPQHLAESTALYRDLDGLSHLKFLGMDLSESAQRAISASGVMSALPYLFFIFLVALTSYIQQKQVSGRNSNVQMNPTQKTMIRIMPVFFAFMSFTFVAGLIVYFLTSNFFRVGQQAYITKKIYAVEGNVLTMIPLPGLEWLKERWSHRGSPPSAKSSKGKKPNRTKNRAKPKPQGKKQTRDGRGDRISSKDGSDSNGQASPGIEAKPRKKKRR